jgi:hypothetical protein
MRLISWTLRSGSEQFEPTLDLSYISLENTCKVNLFYSRLFCVRFILNNFFYSILFYSGYVLQLPRYTVIMLYSKPVLQSTCSFVNLLQ